MKNPNKVSKRYRWVGGNSMTKRERKVFQKRGYRLYSTKCAYTFSHTKHWCGHNDCPEG